MAKKKKAKAVNAVATDEQATEEETAQAQPQEVKEEVVVAVDKPTSITVVEPTPKKQKDYKKTVRFGKDRFGNPRSQRDFESNLRNFLDAEEAYKAWTTWSKGGTVTLVIKK